MADPAIERYLEETASLAQSLGIKGTPAFVVGDTLVQRALDAEGLQKLVAAARSGE